MFDLTKLPGNIRRVGTALVIGMAVDLVGTDASELVSPHWSKPVSVAFWIAVTCYLLMKWAEVNFAKNPK